MVRVKRQSRNDDLCLGRVLRRLRLANGMTQETLGELIDLSYQQIQKYEIGANRIAFSTFRRLATALKVSPHELLTEAEAEIANGA